MGYEGDSGSGSDKRGGGSERVDQGDGLRGGGSSASARDKPSRGTNSPERIAAATRSRVVGGG